MKRFIITLTLILSIVINSFAASDTLNPVEDGFFYSFGGGEGATAILKFDISSIPANSLIMDVTLQVYVFDTLGSNGNMRFSNLTLQDWMDEDSSAKFDPFIGGLYVDSILQVSGFGDSIGWAGSVDIKSLFQIDYGVSNNYFSVRLKDPDDGTCCGALGPGFTAFLGNSSDSIAVGNYVFGESMLFYPNEYASISLRPKLMVNYIAPPSINVQPQDTNIVLCVGDSTTLSISASGESLSFQWQKNGADVPGAVDSIYVLNAMTIDTPGSNYWCIVSNPAGADTSDMVFVRIDSCPLSPVVITSHPDSLTNLCLGDSVLLSVSATGDSLAYQWQKNGIDIAGANNASYLFIAISMDTAGSIYNCIVDNPVSMDTSNNAIIKVDSCPYERIEFS